MSTRFAFVYLSIGLQSLNGCHDNSAALAARIMDAPNAYYSRRG